VTDRSNHVFEKRGWTTHDDHPLSFNERPILLSALDAGRVGACLHPWEYGEIISTGFAEPTVHLVVSKRFAKKQQM
jgi:hypothetical protein